MFNILIPESAHIMETRKQAKPSWHVRPTHLHGNPDVLFQALTDQQGIRHRPVESEYLQFTLTLHISETQDIYKSASRIHIYSCLMY